MYSKLLLKIFVIIVKGKPCAQRLKTSSLGQFPQSNVLISLTMFASGFAVIIGGLNDYVIVNVWVQF